MSSAELRIFPLPRIQLFPRALLPLHVFEPRYRALVADALADDSLIGLPQHAPDADDDPPSLSPIFGVGRIVAHAALPDGRSNILLAGLYRARIVEEPPRRELYRRVSHQPLRDVGEADPSAAASLTAIAEQLAARIPAGGDELRELIAEHTGAAALSDVLAAALIGDPDERQSLLETLDVRTRVDRMLGHLGAALRKFSAREVN